MAKRNRNTTSRKIEKRIKEGRGQGEKENYRPWLTIHDVVSEGVSSRGRGWKTNTDRVHNFISRGELAYFYLAEWSPIVTDIREQFPLSLEHTTRIAERLGIRHPIDTKTKELFVMTTDFMLTVNINGKKQQWARTYKPINKITYRQLAKFEIERNYYLERGIDWGIVTDRDILWDFAKNIEFLHDAYYAEEINGVDETTIYYIASEILKEYSQNNKSLSNTTTKKDMQLGLDSGTSLSIVRHMLATKRWSVDMYNPIKPTRRIVLSEDQSEITEKGGIYA